MQAHISGGFKIDLFCLNMMHGVQPECKPTFAKVSKSIYFARVRCIEPSLTACKHLGRLGKHLFWRSTMHVARSDLKPKFGEVVKRFILAEYYACSSA